MYYEEINYATQDYPFLIEHKDVKYIPHFHKEPELVFVIEGELTITIENNTFILKKGEICIFTPGLIHNLYSYTPNKSFVMKLFPVLDLGNIQLSKNVVNSDDAIYDELLENIICIINENQEKNPGYKLAVNIYVEKIFLTIIRNMKYRTLANNALTKLENKNVFLNSVTDFLNEHFADKFTIDDVSKHLNYTKSYFCHYFKKTTGITFWKYYTIFRLEKAIQMMKQFPKKSFAEIAENSGFKNIRSFNQSFKEYHQCSPGKYMNKYYG